MRSSRHRYPGTAALSAAASLGGVPGPDRGRPSSHAALHCDLSAGGAVLRGASARRSITSHHELDPRPRREPRTPARGTSRTASAIANDRIVAPGPMTYGSQAAAASQVFEQQRDLALRERRSSTSRRSRRHSRARRGPVRPVHVVRPTHRRPSDSRRSRGPPCASTASASAGAAPMTSEPVETAAELVSIEAIRAAAADARAASRCARRCSPSGRPNARHFLKAESPPADRRLQDPRRLRRGRLARRRGACAAASSRTRRATTPRASRARLDCSARRPWSSCPSDAPAIKRDRVEADGAEIVIVGTASEEREAVAERIAAERGLSIIPPYDDDRIIAGQGTIGLEIVEDVPDLAAVLVPIGGGGLSSGVAVAVRALHPERAGHRRRARARRRRAASLREGRHRPLGGRGRRADHRRRDADQAIGVRPFAHLSASPRRRRHGRRKRRSPRRSGSSPRRRAWSSSRRAPVRRGAARFRAREAGIAALDGPVVAIGQRRERRPGALPRLPRGADPRAESADPAVPRRRAASAEVRARRPLARPPPIVVPPELLALRIAPAPRPRAARLGASRSSCAHPAADDAQDRRDEQRCRPPAT